MAHGISIHLGLNTPGPECCTQEVRKGCELDAQIMAELARVAGFEVVPPLVGTAATWANVEAEVIWASQRLKDGDFLLVTASSHACELKDGACMQEKCEALCLADRRVPDHEIHQLWARINPGVRVVVVVNSCYSAGLNQRLTSRRAKHVEDRSYGRARVREDGFTFIRPADERQGRVEPRSGAAPRDGMQGIPTGADLKTSVLFLASSRRGEPSQDDERGGLFTTVLRHVWNGGQFKGGYEDFIDQICTYVAEQYQFQHPTAVYAGPYPTWIDQQPFKI